jgi:hypothetical protein
MRHRLLGHRDQPPSQPTNPAADPCRFEERIGGGGEGHGGGARTQRERDWLAAIELYYSDYDKLDQTTRGRSYEKAMERLAQKYPDDLEAAAFYALALNETALHSDKTYAKQLKAGAILEKVAATLPEHPGVLHYLIHTYDYPLLAQRGLDAANKYAGVAPAAQHAQHMPAHTYSMLGAMGAIGRIEHEIAGDRPGASGQALAGRDTPRRAAPSRLHGIRAAANGTGGTCEAAARRQQRRQEARV